ncbi:hypothetical protein TrCOL_g4403 [Triparma columacea]|uniref:Uncharacterized protein n=1 Tax=Triparma columacea TaxID=722753 RepID=A0A9W7LCB5_9STRA|nr:hypothetical protein TrCOL_g4403 [Triparma columacea]
MSLLKAPKIYGPQEIADDVVSRLSAQVDFASKALVTGLVVGAAVATGVMIGAALAYKAAGTARGEKKKKKNENGRRGGAEVFKMRIGEETGTSDVKAWATSVTTEGLRDRSCCLLKVPKGWKAEEFRDQFEWVEEGEEEDVARIVVF